MLTDPIELQRLVDLNAPEGLVGDDFDAADWLANPANFALSDGDDLGMFEAGTEWPGPVSAHVIFASRGQQAIDTAQRMLAQVFAFGATEVLGETPLKLPQAMGFAAKLGFEPYGEDDRPMGRVSLSRLTPDSFLKHLVKTHAGMTVERV
jgi:hypothetical protein